MLIKIFLNSLGNVIEIKFFLKSFYKINQAVL